jgi:hypothetical protein
VLVNDWTICQWLMAICILTVVLFLNRAPCMLFYRIRLVSGGPRLAEWSTFACMSGHRIYAIVFLSISRYQRVDTCKTFPLDFLLVSMHLVMASFDSESLVTINKCNEFSGLVFY